MTARRTDEVAPPARAPEPTEAEPPSAVLQRETRAQHAAREQSPLARAMARGELPLAEYAPLLAATHATNEAVLYAGRGLLPRAMLAGLARQSTWLRRDLELLRQAAQSPFEGSFVPAALAAVAPHRRHPYRLLGWGYVLLGAALGSRAVEPRMRQSLGEQAPFHFYGGQARHGKRTFELVCAELDRLLFLPGPLRAAVLGARSAFWHTRRDFQSIRGPAGSAARAPASFPRGRPPKESAP